MSAKGGEKKKSTEEANVDWRQKSIEKFKLKEIPTEWTTEALLSKSKGDNETWKQYYCYRTKKKAFISGLDNDLEGNWPAPEIRQQLKDLATTVGFPEFSDHSLQYIADITFEDYKEIRSVTYKSIVFSPYALPQAIVLEHRYHYRTRYHSVEFGCYWHFQLLGFDNTNMDYANSRQTKYYMLEDGMELLCNNVLLDDDDGYSWSDVEDIDVSNFTPSTVRRLRTWIFGSLQKSTEVMNDFDLLRLLLTTIGGAEFGSFSKDFIGHTFKFYDSCRNGNIIDQMIADGVVKDEDEALELPDITWLEYQVRLVSGALRKQDRYYVGYDQRQAKADWRERKRGSDYEEEDEGSEWFTLSNN